MPLTDEALAARTPIGSTLASGNEQISIDQTITFTLYERVVLPLDGYVFLVESSPPQTLTALGSFHQASDVHQDDSETFTVHSILFTSEIPINDLDAVNPNQLYIAEFEGTQFAFSARGSFYRQTQMYHYRGNAIYPDMGPQVVTSSADLNPDDVIVSNSLPLWLALNGYTPINSGAGVANPVTMYPATLIPLNLAPPWASVDIQTDTFNGGLQATANIAPDGSQSQLVTERVRITLYGLRNEDALTFIQCVNQYSLNYGTFGIMNVPIPRDEKRTQAELQTIAQKKTVEFEISYYQQTVRSVARQLILKAKAAITITSD